MNFSVMKTSELILLTVAIYTSVYFFTMLFPVSSVFVFGLLLTVFIVYLCILIAKDEL